jgi:hypothetical protein
MKLPNEIILQIYEFSDAQTRIAINKIFRWNYRFANPFQSRPLFFLPANYMHNLSGKFM